MSSKSKKASVHAPKKALAQPAVQPTSNAIRKLFASARHTPKEDAKEGFVVAVFPDGGNGRCSGLNPCLVSDGKDYARGYFLGSSFAKKSVSGALSSVDKKLPTKPFWFHVKSYIVSKSSARDHLLFLTDGTLLHGSVSRIKKPPTEGCSGFRPSAGTAVRGLAGVAPLFLGKWGQLLPSEVLAGRSCVVGCNHNNHEKQQSLVEQHANTLANFLAHHQAVSTLHHRHSTSTAGYGSERSSDLPQHVEERHNMHYYMSALKEFQSSQMDRQKASLTSNSGREDNRRAQLIETQYIKALELAIGVAGGNTEMNMGATHQPELAPSLTRQTICFWHSILCGNGIHPEAGRLRTKDVRVDHIHFVNHTQVPSDLDYFCESLLELEGKLFRPTSSTSPRNQPGENLTGWHVATFAAMVFFGVVDVHGFADGNGRLALIALNWALQKAGLPFVVHLFATPTQRREYTEAIAQTQRNLSLVTVQLTGDAQSSISKDPDGLLKCAFEFAGAFKPLVDLILDRVAKAVSEFEKMVQDKSRLVSEEADAKAAKKIRDRERAGTCLICFEDNPNIATLCCGKAVHLNCVAQWISSNATCPNCREGFPALPRRIHPDEVSESTNHTSDYYSDDASYSAGDDDDSGSYMTGDSTEALRTLAVAAAAALHDRDDDEEEDEDYFDDNDDEDDDTVTITMEVDHGPDEDDDSMSRFSPRLAETESLDSTGSASALVEDAIASTFCLNGGCRNRAARDCINGSCRRCCLVHGRYECSRHGCE